MIRTNEKPKIMSLEVEPVENLKPTEINDKNPLKEDEDLPIEEVTADDEIFKRTPQPEQSKPPKPKKKALSKRQKAHMEKMRKAKAMKIAEKKRLEAEKEEVYRQHRLDKLKEKVESNKPVKAEIPKEIKKQLPKQVVKQVEAVTKPKPRGMSNQDYMKEFFSNLNMFMDSYNKLNSSKKNVQIKTSKKQEKKEPEKPEGNRPRTVSFRTPMVSYRNVRNPFNF